jgi:hypothetical protein
VGAGTKTTRVRFGGLTGTILFSRADTTSTRTRVQMEIANRGATNSQHSHAQLTISTGAVAFDVGTASHDTTAAQDLVISGQKATAGDTITLQSYLVELIPG